MLHRVRWKRPRLLKRKQKMKRYGEYVMPLGEETLMTCSNHYN